MRQRLSGLLPLMVVMALLMFVGTACTPAAVDEPEGTTQEAPSGTTEEAPEEAAPTTYEVDLVPADGVTSSATGKTMLEVGPDSVSFKLDVENLSDVMMAHIHIADAAGGKGSPGVWLYTTEKAPKLIPGITNGELSAGTFAAADLVGPLEGKTIDDLVTAIEEGRAYVNVHTEANPDGEITGFLK